MECQLNLGTSWIEAAKPRTSTTIEACLAIIQPIASTAFITRSGVCAAQGKSFADICLLSDLFEGSIIRATRRLDELMHQLEVWPYAMS